MKYLKLLSKIGQSSFIVAIVLTMAIVSVQFNIPFWLKRLPPDMPALFGTVETMAKLVSVGFAGLLVFAAADDKGGWLKYFIITAIVFQGLFGSNVLQHDAFVKSVKNTDQYKSASTLADIATTDAATRANKGWGLYEGQLKEADSLANVRDELTTGVGTSEMPPVIEAAAVQVQLTPILALGALACLASGTIDAGITYLMNRLRLVWNPNAIPMQSAFVRFLLALFSEIARFLLALFSEIERLILAIFGWARGKFKKGSPPTPPANRDKPTLKTPMQKTGSKAAERRAKVRQLLDDNPSMTQRQIADKLKVSLRTIQRDISDILK